MALLWNFCRPFRSTPPLHNHAQPHRRTLCLFFAHRLFRLLLPRPHFSRRAPAGNDTEERKIPNLYRRSGWSSTSRLGFLDRATPFACEGTTYTIQNSTKVVAPTVLVLKSGPGSRRAPPLRVRCDPVVRSHLRGAGQGTNGQPRTDQAGHSSLSCP